MPKISAIVPIYNSEPYLERCLNSLVNQSFTDFEIILVNDGSPDNSQSIIERYKENYPHLIQVIEQENRGQASARNKGLSLARGEFISFVDGDDYLELSAYEIAYREAVEKGADIVCFGMYEEKGGERTEQQYVLAHSPCPSKHYILNESSPCNKIISRRIFAEHNLQFTKNRIYEDLELIPRLALYTNKITVLDHCLYTYVIHENSTMRQPVYSPKFASIYAVMDTLLEEFRNTEYRQELEFIYIEHLLHSAVLRYLQYPEGTEDIKRISAIMRERFPHWRKNQYFQAMSWQYKLFCHLAYRRAISILKIIMR